MRNTKVKLIVSLLVAAVLLTVGTSMVLHFVNTEPEQKPEETTDLTDTEQLGITTPSLDLIPAPEEPVDTEPTIPPVSDPKPDDTLTAETPQEPEETPTTPTVPEEDITTPPNTEEPAPDTQGDGELNLNVEDKRDENSNRAPTLEGDVTITPETKEVDE